MVHMDVELTGVGRAVAWLIGRERVERWVDQPEPARCPWTTSVERLRCVKDAGHPGACRTEKPRTNAQTGRTVTETREWWGINYS